MIGGDIASKHIARKLDNLNALSLDKLEASGRKVLEGLSKGSVRAERGGSSSCYINSKKRGNEVLNKNRKEELNVGYLSTFDKAKKSTSPPRIRSLSTSNKANMSAISRKIRHFSDCDKADKRKSPPTMKRSENGRSVSSSTENLMRMSSPETKLRKVNGESRTSGVTDRRSKNNDKKIIRKHLHVRAYKKLLTKDAKAGENHGDKCIKENSPLQGNFMDSGADTSREVKVGGDVGTTKEGVHDERELGLETIESLEKGSKCTKLLETVLDARSTPDSINQEHKTKFSGSECGRMVPDLKSFNLLESSGQEIYNHDPREVNTALHSSMLEELGIEDGGDCNSEFPGTPDKQISEENILTVQKDSTNTQTEHNLCFVCKQPGQFICCCGKGCRRSYHLSCLNPELRDVPPGAWLCNLCVKKKMDLGVYSVSDGIESVWDVDEGMQSGKRYFVKYKGLAHVHNRWISESELLQENPSLIANLVKYGLEVVNKWRKEWTEPERLLQKRLVAPFEVANAHTSVSVSESLNCCTEWFVKWKGLEYDQASWELENSLLSYSSAAPRLIKDYECRGERVNRSYDPLRADMALQVRKNPFCKMSKLPECPVEFDNDHLSAVNFLREFWYKSLNAVLIDGQERISKSILFVLSLQSHACRPSLIITTSGSLQLWQADFFRLAPSVNIVTYQGDKDVRKIIQNLEFYEESGRLMFQVLLADPKAIVEDLVDIACISWESIIVDECQNPKTTRYLEQLNTLTTDFKLLLFNGQPMDSFSEYHLLLSFLSTGRAMYSDLVGLQANSNDHPLAVTKLKEKLARHIVFECKTDSSKFLEYWVPVPLSSVQLEQYCATLFSNAAVLRSSLRSDVAGALQNLLNTVRKCCDHPYLVDGGLRCLLTKGLQGVDFLNAEVCASGKLYVLGKILQDIKDRGLRVVVLFQSLGGSEKVSLGDMLDDFLQERFGVHTYERIETGMIMAKKVAALKKFNNKETGRFAFLIEKRACLPSVKLRSVDAIILFNSDWNPLNDLRSLQKMTVESQHNCIRVFRFYTSYTVEEKLLMLAREDIILESSVESISRNIMHLLLAWGTSYLFQKLDQLHLSSPTCISEPSFEKFCLNDVILEILTLLPGKTETSRAVPCSILVNAPLIGGTYSRNSVLVGEKEGISLLDKDLSSFWSRLLEGRHPKWKYISGHSHKIRRRIQNANASTIQAVEGDEVKSKRRKINNIVNQVTLPESSKEKGDAPEGMLQRNDEELCTNEHTRPAEALTSGNDQNMDSSHMVTVPASDSVVTLSPNIEMMGCNDVERSNSTNCPLPLAEHEQERFSPAQYQEETPLFHRSVELTEVPAQQEIMAAGQIFGNTTHSLRPLGYLPSEEIPTENHRSTATQYGMACDWSNSSTQQAEVVVQDAIETAVFESEPSIRQIPENNPHSMRPQDNLPLERTHSEHLRSADIQQDEPNQLFRNLQSIEWVPAQAVSVDPIHNELYRVQRQYCSCTKKYENKKLLLQSDCEQEMEKIRKKYHILLQDAEKEYLHEKGMIWKIFQKILWHRFFAKEVMFNYYDHKESPLTSFQAPIRNSSHHLQASQSQPQLVPLSTPFRPLPSQALNQTHFLPFLRPQVSIPPVMPIHPPELSTHTPPVISNNMVRGPINPRPNMLFARFPAPHLQRGRPPHTSDPTTNTPLNPQLPIPTLVSTATPSVPPPNFVSTYPAVSNAGGIPQPTGSSPLQFVLPQLPGDEGLLETLLANFPAADDEFFSRSMMDSRPDVIYLSEED